MMVAGWPRFDLYVITDTVLSHGRSALEIARAALEGGADAVQLRDKSSPAFNLCRLVSEIQPQARKFGALLVVNDRVDVALVCGADGRTSARRTCRRVRPAGSCRAPSSWASRPE